MHSATNQNSAKHNLLQHNIVQYKHKNTTLENRNRRKLYEFTMTMAADSNTRGSVWINTFLEGEK